MLCACLSSVEWAYKHEPQCHRRPARSADVPDVGHVMTILTMFEKSPKSHLLSDRHTIFSPELCWPSSVRLRRERANSASGLAVVCDRTCPVLTKSDFRILNFVTLLTGSGNRCDHVTPLSRRGIVPCVQKWNPHVDITSGSAAIARPSWRKRLF